MRTNNFTIVISSCEKYRDLWLGQISLLKKHWPDLTTSIIILSDNSPMSFFMGCNVFNCGAGTSLPKRLQIIANSVKTKYIFLTLDDYMLNKDVDTKRISELISEMENLKLDYLRLFKYPRIKKRNKISKGIYKLNLNDDYQVNLYPGLWEVNFLHAVSKTEDDPWHFEPKLTKIAKKMNANCAATFGHEYIFIDTVRKGMFLRKGRKHLINNNLYEGNRKLMPLHKEIYNKTRHTIRQFLPKFILYGLKKFLRLFGAKFYSD